MSGLCSFLTPARGSHRKEQAMSHRFEHLTSACAALLTSLIFVAAALPF
jgi:hypothetical protein